MNFVSERDEARFYSVWTAIYPLRSFLQATNAHAYSSRDIIKITDEKLRRIPPIAALLASSRKQKIVNETVLYVEIGGGPKHMQHVLQLRFYSGVFLQGGIRRKLRASNGNTHQINITAAEAGLVDWGPFAFDVYDLIQALKIR